MHSLARLEMTVISWVTDETNDIRRSVNLLRKLLGYAAELCAVQLMPVIIAGSFRLPLHLVKQVAKQGPNADNSRVPFNGHKRPRHTANLNSN